MPSLLCAQHSMRARTARTSMGVAITVFRFTSRRAQERAMALAPSQTQAEQTPMGATPQTPAPAHGDGSKALNTAASEPKQRTVMIKPAGLTNAETAKKADVGPQSPEFRKRSIKQRKREDVSAASDPDLEHAKALARANAKERSMKMRSDEARRRLWKRDVKEWLAQHDKGSDWDLPESQARREKKSYKFSCAFNKARMLMQWYNELDDSNEEKGVTAADIGTLFDAWGVQCSDQMLSLFFEKVGKKTHEPLTASEFLKLFSVPGEVSSMLAQSRKTAENSDLFVMAHRRQRVLEDIKSPLTRKPFASQEAFALAYERPDFYLRPIKAAGTGEDDLLRQQNNSSPLNRVETLGKLMTGELKITQNVGLNQKFAAAATLQRKLIGEARQQNNKISVGAMISTLTAGGQERASRRFDASPADGVSKPFALSLSQPSLAVRTSGQLVPIREVQLQPGDSGKASQGDAFLPNIENAASLKGMQTQEKGADTLPALDATPLRRKSSAKRLSAISRKGLSSSVSLPALSASKAALPMMA